MTLTINNISKSYGTNLALNNFTATLDAGIYALLGPNGSGKSTLMNILTDNLKADSGEITYDGENVLDMGVRFREKLGFMPQYPGLYANFTVERFLWYMAALKGIEKSEAQKQIPEILAAVELDDVPKRKIGALSGGMKQRLTLAQAVLGDPEILILDEATSSIDTRTEALIEKGMDTLMEGRTSFIVAHRLSTIREADIILVMKDGNIIEQGTHEELLGRKGFYAKLYNSQFSS